MEKILEKFKFKRLMMREIDISCRLKKNRNIQDFAIQLLYITINNCLKFRMTNKLKNLLVETIYIENNKYIVKPGLNRNEINRVVNLVLNKEFIKFREYFNNRLHVVYGALYKFTYDVEFILEFINRDKMLQNKLIEVIKKLFSIELKWKEFLSMIDEENKWIVLDLLINLTSCPITTVRRNLNNQYYIRDKYTLYEYYKGDLGCSEEMKNNKNYGVVYGSSFYKINDKSFYAKIMEKYKRNYLAGPSSSVILLHIYVYNILKLNIDKKYILALAVSDYIPFSHTLTEILLTYSSELEIEYNLEIDPVDFTEKFYMNIYDFFINI